jgi:hypothetical protein
MNEREKKGFGGSIMHACEWCDVGSYIWIEAPEKKKKRQRITKTERERREKNNKETPKSRVVPPDSGYQVFGAVNRTRASAFGCARTDQTFCWIFLPRRAGACICRKVRGTNQILFLSDADGARATPSFPRPTPWLRPQLPLRSSSRDRHRGQRV